MHTISRLSLLAIAVNVSACTHHVWRGPEGEPCHLMLINEFGGIHVNASLPSASAPVLTGHSGMNFDSVTSDGQTTLTVTKPDDPDASDVELLAPAHCGVTARTTDGPVSVAAGSRIPSLTVATTTCNIALEIAPATTAEISLATSGEISTDYTIDIEYKYHEEPAKYGRVVTGSETGGSASDTPAKIELRSLRGDVSVLRPDLASDQQ